MHENEKKPRSRVPVALQIRLNTPEKYFYSIIFKSQFDLWKRVKEITGTKTKRYLENCVAINHPVAIHTVCKKIQCPWSRCISFPPQDCPNVRLSIYERSIYLLPASSAKRIMARPDSSLISICLISPPPDRFVFSKNISRISFPILGFRPVTKTAR